MWCEGKNEVRTIALMPRWASFDSAQYCVNADVGVKAWILNSHINKITNSFKRFFEKDNFSWMKSNFIEKN